MGRVAGIHHNVVDIWANKDVVVDVGGGILDWEDEYGVVESYHNDSVTASLEVAPAET